jgi:C1A family cysteine protease
MLYIIAVFLAIAFSLTLDEARTEFSSFKTRFGRSYPTKEAETFRFNVFRANLERAHAKNALRTSEEAATFGVTKFSDMTTEEFRAQYLLSTPVKPDYSIGSVWNSTGVGAPAATVNWFSQGACTSVYNQEQCGSCWAFSITEAIESAVYLSGQSLQSLSMQQVVSCDTGDDGCSGGDPPTAYQYVISAGGLESYSDYPYSSGNGYSGSCNFQSGDIAASISNWQWVTQSSDEGAMMSFVSSTGPPSICVDASSWSSYTGGIVMASQCGTSLDHCVQLVGYDSDYYTPYWTVRNSWGTDWGENGFIRLQYGQDTCGVATEVTWPTV